MSPEERQLLNALFDRIRNTAMAPRDAEAEALIADQVRAQPYAPYLLAQAVIVQEQALKAANDKLQALQTRVQELEQLQAGHAGGPAPAGGGFLSGLGSLFGAGNPPPPRTAAPAQSPWQQQPGGPWQQGPGPGPQAYPPQGGASPGPWGAAAPQGGGGGFLKGALGAAAGVAGGVLLADSIRGLFGGHNNPFGITSGMSGFTPGTGGETIVNNYYENNDPGGRDANVADNPDYDDDVADAGYDDPGYDSGSDDDGYNV